MNFVIDLKLFHYYISNQDLAFYVKDEHYFFMGDNRDNSLNGSYFGQIPRSYLKGQAKFITYNFSFNNSFPFIKWERSGIGLQ